MKGAAVVLALALAAWPRSSHAAAAPRSLSAAVLRQLEATTEYRELLALSEKERRQGGQSTRARRLLDTLARLRAEAASASTVDPEHPKGRRVVNFTHADGRVTRLGSLVPSLVEKDQEMRLGAAAIVCRFILEFATTEGLIPFDPPPAVREAFDEAMKTGLEAAKRGDYRSAISAFEQGRRWPGAADPRAPELHYNLGLAESKIPGRELRAAVWLGAFLAAEPRSPSAPAIKELMRELDRTALTRFLALTEELTAKVPDHERRELALADVAGLWARAGDEAAALRLTERIGAAEAKAKALASIAGAQARAGDVAAARLTAARIPGVDGRSKARFQICEAQLGARDLAGAIETADGILGAFDKALARQRIADAQSQAGQSAAALRTLALALSLVDDVQEPDLRNVLKQRIAGAQARAGDVTAALATAGSIPEPFNVSLAQQEIAEQQANAGDWPGSYQTMATALETGHQVKDAYSQRLVMEAHAAANARIDAGLPGEPKEPLVNAGWAPNWVSRNETSLSAPCMVELAATLKAIPGDDPAEIAGALEEMASAMVEAHELTSQMLNQAALLR